MSRGFLASLERSRLATLREMERQARLRARAIRDAERAEKARQRERTAEGKERQKLYVESRIAEVDEKNRDLEQAIVDLSELLKASLDSDSTLNFDSLLTEASIPKLDLESLTRPIPQARREDFLPTKPHWIVAWLPWISKAYDKGVLEAEEKFAQRREQDVRKEAGRLEVIRLKHLDHDRLTKKLNDEADAHNQEIRAFRSAFETGDATAIATAMKMVLSSSPYPEGFPRHSNAFYVMESKQLLVEYDLPLMDDVIPTDKSYKYVKASDTETSTPRSNSQRRALYASIVAETVLRSVSEIFRADTYGHIESLVFNGYVNAVDRGTGQEVRPCLVTLRTTKDILSTFDLRRVDATACLVTLNASVSNSPSELAPVRPILELHMVDPRFVQEADVLSTLDQRPNLMELKPSEFESLITNLFQKMGLDTKQTRASRDGGVDCVAFDPRPIFGGKVVIQAKRYKNTVGVSAVRDLYGTMQNEGATKGILVTTSGYGKASFEFANDKPLELLGGSNLLYLLKEHAAIEAKIVMPEDWEDPQPDSPSP
jgi:restriction system protein